MKPDAALSADTLDEALEQLPPKYLWRVLFNGKNYTATAHSPMGTALTPDWHYQEAEADTPIAAVLAVCNKLLEVEAGRAALEERPE